MEPLTASIPVDEASRLPRSRWAKLGLAGFLFFLAKGLLWLLLAAVVWIRS